MPKQVIWVMLLGALFVLAWQLMPLPQSGLPKDRSHGKAAIGGAFEMVDHRGEAFTEANLKGRYSVLYFGFTYCPDICPAGLLTLTNAMDALPEAKREQLQPVFVSVDPGRDTPEVLSQYVSNFHPKLVGLTGSEDQVAGIAKAYKVYYSKAPSKPGEHYLVDHSGYFYLMGPDGDFVSHFPHNVSSQSLADALRSHIDS